MLEIRKIDVKSAAKVVALLFAVAYLFLGLTTLILVYLGSFPGLEREMVPIGSQIASLFLYPLLGAITGYIFGGVCAIIYNFISKHTVPLKVDIVEESS